MATSSESSSCACSVHAENDINDVFPDHILEPCTIYDYHAHPYATVSPIPLLRCLLAPKIDSVFPMYNLPLCRSLPLISDYVFATKKGQVCFAFGFRTHPITKLYLRHLQFHLLVHNVKV